MVLLIVRGLLRRPSLSGSPTVTICSVHIHNVVAKKRDASTELLQRLHGYLREHNVDFIGGDFNMSAFSTVGDVFTDDEFSAPGNSLLWGLGALEEPNRECAGFLIIMFRTSLITSLSVLATRTSLSCSTKTPLSVTLWCSRTRWTPQAKVRGVWFYSSFEACCDALHFLVHRQLHFARYTFTTLWPKNVMHIPSFLHRFHGYMREHNVDFIGGDFNMRAFSTVGEVFSDTEFSAPGISFLWGLGALENPDRECAGFLIMPKRPYEWRVDTHGCYKFDNATLGLGPRDQTAHFPVFLHLRTTNLPRLSSIMRSEQAQQRGFERRHNKHERMRRRRT